MQFILIGVLVLAFIVAPLSSSAVTWHVPSQCPTIQAGMDSAAVGDTVLVAPGTYTGDGNRDIDFGGRDLVLMSEDGSLVTTLDCQGSESDPHHAFYFHSGETGAAIVQGFTVRNGWGPYTGPLGSPTGGGLWCSGSSPMIIECTFSGNSADFGGGMYCGESSSPTLIECTFSQNYARFAAGVGCSDHSSPSLRSCTFSGNIAATGGGGLWCQDYCSPSVEVCVFSENQGGGAGFGDYSAATLTDCVFYGNTSDNSAGGMFCGSYSDVVMIDCMLSENAACWGGGMEAYVSSPTLIRCTFTNNTASMRGGGMQCYSSPAVLTNCTFSGNSGHLSGGGIHCYYSTPSIEETIVAFSTEGEAISCGGLLEPYLECCDIYGNAGGDWVGCIAGQDTINNNFSADPLFCDPDNGDFRLSSESPCVKPWLDPACGEFIGASGVGCGTVGVARGRTFSSTWGLVKSIFCLQGER